MCGYISADVNTSQGGPTNVSAKSTELYVIKTRPPIVKLFNFWHFMNKVAFFTHSCVLDSKGFMCGIKGFCEWKNKTREELTLAWGGVMGIWGYNCLPLKWDLVVGPVLVAWWPKILHT